MQIEGDKEGNDNKDGLLDKILDGRKEGESDTKAAEDGGRDDKIIGVSDGE